MDQNTTMDVKTQFLAMKTRQDVARLLDIKDRSLRYFLFKRRPENMYTTFKVPKGNGGYRQIAAPAAELKAIQRKLAVVLSSVYEPKVCAYGFIDGKNILGNAAKHTKRNFILNIDLENFFTQIHFGRIRGMLMHPPYSIGEEAATTIAQIACFNQVLPQGAPSSPILSNMICAPLDNSLMKLAKRTGCTYTRYADDITFSTSKKRFNESVVYLRDDEVVIGNELLAILDRHSFYVNPNKIALRSRYDRQEVTGLTTNLFPNVRRSYVKQLRAILHKCEKFGVYPTAREYVAKGYCKNDVIRATINEPEEKNAVVAWFKDVLKGKIGFIREIKGDSSLTYLSFAQKLNKIFQEEIFDVSALMTIEEVISQNTFVVESTCTENQGSGFFLEELGFITSYHVTENYDFYRVFFHCEYPHIPVATIQKSLNEISSDKTIDYALYRLENKLGRPGSLRLGDSRQLGIGSRVIIGGYPNFQKGNSPNIQTCYITSLKQFHGASFYTVSGRIVHGASGGVVLNEDLEVVGIIKGGIVTLSEDDANENQGFVPIHLVIDDLGSKKIDYSLVGKDREDHKSPTRPA